MTREDGFSLIEILAALAILAAGLMCLATMSITSLHSLDRSGEETTAMILAQQQVEWLRNHAYDGAMLASGTISEGLTGDYEGYVRVTTIVDDVPVPGVKRITVMTTSPSGRVVDVAALLAE